jgi:hypothetical protein
MRLPASADLNLTSRTDSTLVMAREGPDRTARHATHPQRGESVPPHGAVERGSDQ